MVKGVSGELSVIGGFAKMNIPPWTWWTQNHGWTDADGCGGHIFLIFRGPRLFQKLSRSGTTAELCTCRSCARGGDEVATCPAVERIIDNYPVKKMIPVPQFGFGHDLSAQLG